MTENEFRDALKKSVGHAGLSSDRQSSVLARMKGGRRKVCTWSKMKIVLVLGLITLMMTGTTIAAGLAGVDWQGNLTQPPLNIPLTDYEGGERLQELSVPTNAQLVTVLKLNSSAGDVAFLGGTTSDHFASSLAEMQAWVTADGALPWPVAIPAAYQQLRLGRVGYACDGNGSLVRVSQERTEDGYLRTCFEIPDEHRFMSNYFMRMLDADGQELTINVSMQTGGGLYQSFPVTEESKVTPLQVPEMEGALYIDSPEENMLAVYCPLKTARDYKTVDVAYDGRSTQSIYTFCNLVIVMTSPELTAAEMLSIFGLEAQ